MNLQYICLLDIAEDNGEYIYSYGIHFKVLFFKKYKVLTLLSQRPDFVWSDVDDSLYESGFYFEDLFDGKKRSIGIGSVQVKTFSSADNSKFGITEDQWKKARDKAVWKALALEKKRKSNMPPVIGDILELLDEAEEEFYNYPSEFSEIRKNIESMLDSHSEELAKQIKDAGKQADIWMYSTICNLSGDFAESGNFHFYRGMLNPTGKNYLAIFDASIDQLVDLGEIEAELAKDQKSKLREGIASVG